MVKITGQNWGRFNVPLDNYKSWIKSVSSSNDSATINWWMDGWLTFNGILSTQVVAIACLISSPGNTPSYSWPNQSSDVDKIMEFEGGKNRCIETIKHTIFTDWLASLCTDKSKSAGKQNTSLTISANSHGDKAWTDSDCVLAYDP